MTIQEQNKFIERQRGRMRRLKKSGVYSPALAQLERRAEQAGINPFSTSRKMSDEDRERQLNLLWQFSRAKTSTLEGARAQQVANMVAVRKAKGQMSDQQAQDILGMTARQQAKWYNKQKDIISENNFIGQLWDILKSDYQNYKYGEGGSEAVTPMDIKDLIDNAEYQGETESMNIVKELTRYMESTSAPEYAEIYDILHPSEVEEDEDELPF